jgi:hypothetical protein
MHLTRTLVLWAWVLALEHKDKYSKTTSKVVDYRKPRCFAIQRSALGVYLSMSACKVEKDTFGNDFNQRSDSTYQRPSYFDNNIDEWKGYRIWHFSCAHCTFMCTLHKMCSSGCPVTTTYHVSLKQCQCIPLATNRSPGQRSEPSRPRYLKGSSSEHRQCICGGVSCIYCSH